VQRVTPISIRGAVKGNAANPDSENPDEMSSKLNPKKGHDESLTPL